MLTECLSVGNIVSGREFGRKYKLDRTSYRQERNTIFFPIYERDGTKATLRISTLSTPHRDLGDDRDSVQRNSPISVELTQFGLSKEVGVKQDLFLLGRKHFGEDYGGELWLHASRTGVNFDWTVDKDEAGDLAKYRGAIERVLNKVPGGSNQWHRIDDILSFIDGMYKRK